MANNEQEQQTVKPDLSKMKRTNKKTDMPYVHHFYELRKRIMWILILFVVSMAGGFIIADDVIRYLQAQPVAEPINMVVVDITDAFKVYLQFSVAVGLVFTFPLALYQIWAFVSPGLSEKERKISLSYIPGAFLLSLLGLAFAYFWLFPFIVQFMTGIAERLQAQEMYGMPHYFRFLFTFVIPFGFLFQLPLVTFFLTRLGIVTPTLLKKIRKYAYFVLFVLAALITPPELLSHLVVTLPLLLLYELSIGLAHIAYRKKQQVQEDLEQEELAEKD